MNLKQKSFVGAVVITAVVAVAALASAAGSTTRATTVKTGHALGKTVLVNRGGLTLYSLSAETHGHFICTQSCLALWRPLVVLQGQKPTGHSGLATIRRPGGRVQVTYKGKPLYTFSGDHKRGDAKGEGLKDVGVWHAAAVGSTTKAPAAAPQPTTTSPGYYGYRSIGIERCSPSCAHATCEPLSARDFGSIPAPASTRRAPPVSAIQTS